MRLSKSIGRLLAPTLLGLSLAAVAAGARAADWLSYTRIEAGVGRAGGETQRAVEAEGYVGGDTHRLRWRLLGESPRSVAEPTSGRLMYGYRIADYWDAVAGVRVDRAIGGVSRNYAVFGFNGLAPYLFDLDATLSIGSGRALFDIEGRHEMLLTQHWIVYPFAALGAASRSDAQIGLGSGINRTQFGLGTRFEFTRQVAPFVALSRVNLHGGAADAARSAGERANETVVRAGVRFVF